MAAVVLFSERSKFFTETSMLLRFWGDKLMLQPQTAHEQACDIMIYSKKNDCAVLPPPSAAVICSSENKKAIEALRACDNQAILCGMSSRDTITLSSFSETTAMVSLQRRVKTIAGTCVEPFELPLRYNRQPAAYALMCAYAVLLLSGLVEDARQPLVLKN